MSNTKEQKLNDIVKNIHIVLYSNELPDEAMSKARNIMKSPNLSLIELENEDLGTVPKDVIRRKHPVALQMILVKVSSTAFVDFLKNPDTVPPKTNSVAGMFRSGDVELIENKEGEIIKVGKMSESKLVTLLEQYVEKFYTDAELKKYLAPIKKD